jgi:alcohol dehydrogenase
MIPFDFQLRTRIVFGPGTIARLGELAGELGARRAILVSDPGIVSAGHVDRGLEVLRAAGIDTHLYYDVQQNPTTADVELGTRFAHRHEPELIIGFGGGSAMDCAKGINFLYTNGGTMKDYWGVGKALRPMLPMIAVPTTAGTGSETQSFALISDAETHVKMACGDKKASFRIAILDPELTMTQPALVTALTGIDALAHALETYVTKRRNWISLFYSREAWRLLANGLPRVLQTPDDIQARGEMQLGACLAGLAIENSMLGAAHALANPLTANYGIAHGQAIATMLPHVVRFNGQQLSQPYAELLAVLTDQPVPPQDAPRATELLCQRITALVAQAKLDKPLSEQGVPVNALPQLAREAAQQWTAAFNPREVTPALFEMLYEQAFRSSSLTPA